LKAVESQLADTQAALETWEKRALISESREERQTREVAVLRKQVSDCQTIQSENENLVKIVREMKKSLDSQSQIPSALSAADATERQALEEERSLLKLLRQDSLLIVEKEAFRECSHLIVSVSPPLSLTFSLFLLPLQSTS
jgi:hypothetical protein